MASRNAINILIKLLGGRALRSCLFAAKGQRMTMPALAFAIAVAFVVAMAWF